HVAPLIVDGDGVGVRGGVARRVGGVADIEIRACRDAGARRVLARGGEDRRGFAADGEVVGAGDDAGDGLFGDDSSVGGRAGGDRAGAFLVGEQAEFAVLHRSRAGVVAGGGGDAKVRRGCAGEGRRGGGVAVRELF